MSSLKRRLAALDRRICLGAGLLVALLALAAPAEGAPPVAISPLNDTPDASPQTQISFLGVAVGQIADVSVVGSRSGRHSGHLRAYASAPGASFLPVRPFTQGENVRVSALVGPSGHAERVGTSFTVARIPPYRVTFGGPVTVPNNPSLVQNFVSEPDLHPPIVQVTDDAAGQAAGDIFLTPTHGYGQAGVMIVNDAGTLVWFHPVAKGETVTDLRVQSYEGRPVLVWWQGKVSGILGVGFGADHIYSSAYQPVATVSAGNGYQADLHEMLITPQGSAFITAYSLVDADLASAGGSRDGTLQDAIVQEIDIKTGLVMFEWHAYGHVPLSESFSRPPYSASKPWDYFHANSISLDPSGDGDFIVSSRNTWTAYEIDHVSGAILWRLGGHHSSFKMGAGTGTAWQHDVQWQPDGTLTIFDNGAAPKAHSQSRAIHERINWKDRAVELVGRYVHNPPLISGSQGDEDVQPDGNVFVGWGEEPYFSEFSPSGELLFEGHIPYPGQTYRVFRSPWSATPAVAPAVAVRPESASTAAVYASWNGATAVSQWSVAAGPTPNGLATVATAPSSGFETAITVNSSAPYFAVQALGSNGEVLGTSPVAQR